MFRKGAEMESALNSLSINEVNGNIVLPRGATGHFQVDLTTNGELDPEVDRAVFAIASASTSRRSTTYTTVHRKDYPIVRTETGYSVVVDIANEDTSGLEPGSYIWNLTIVTDPEYDNDGMVDVRDRTDGVYPLWSGDSQPTFELRGVAYVI